MKSFFGQLDTELVLWGFDQDRVDLLDDLKGYVKTGECLSYKNKMKYLPFWGNSSTKTGRILGVSPATVRSAILTMSEELYEKKFGYDFFYVAETDLDAARDRFEVVKAYRGIDILFINGFKELLPISKAEIYDFDVDIKNCREEIKFLKKYTKNGVEDELNQENLNYVITLLTDKGGRNERFNLIKFLLK